MAETFNFSGHETFHCRPFWLKKGCDFLNEKRRFADEDAVIYLGVGKNMVTAIRYWMRAFEMANDDGLTRLGKDLLRDGGWDPYLEDVGSLWLLHYHMVKNRHASIAHLIFNQLRDRVPEFTSKQYADFVANEVSKASRRTVEKDFGVFVRNYRDKDREEEEVDDLGGLLADLELLSMKKVDSEKVYFIERKRRGTLPPKVLLYAILDAIPEGRSLSLTVMMETVGKTFALDKDGMTDLLTEVAKTYAKKGVTFTPHAGVYELQFKERPDALTILSEHYAN